MVVKRWYAQTGVHDSKVKAKEQGEVFTPEHVGLDMLDLVFERDPNLVYGTFLDPSCGDGNLLLCVLKVKVEFGIHPYDALASLYGIDVEQSNIDRCQSRLIEYTLSNIQDDENSVLKCKNIINTVLNSSFPRLVCYDTLSWDVENWRPKGINI